MAGRGSAQMIAPLRRSPFASRSARPAITSSTDPALSDRGVNRGDAAPPSPEGRASPSRRSTRFGLRLAAHLLGERRDVGLSYAGVGRGAVRRHDSFRRGRSIRALCQTDRLPSRSRAYAAQSARRVSCAEASPSQRSVRRCPRRDPAEAVRRPAPASSAPRRG